MRALTSILEATVIAIREGIEATLVIGKRPGLPQTLGALTTRECCQEDRLSGLLGAFLEDHQ